MTDAAFVVVGWLGTATVIGAYALHLRRTSRRRSTR
jgi:nitrate reductase gamma subunit